jgi:regulator of protease activity HflC (stomatin/prohibitin superfamily)
MIGLFISIISFLFCIGFILAYLPNKNSESADFLKSAIPLSFIFSLVVLLFSSIVVINATQVGVPVAFGHVGDPIDNGIHFVYPWVTVEEYPIRPITIQLVDGDAVIARTADAGQMTVQLAARWRVERQDASTLYYQSRTGDLDSISNNIVIPNLRQAVGQVYSVTGNLDAISNRDKVSEEIRVELNKLLSVYGIIVDTVSMRSVEPDAATAATISLFASQQQATRIAQEATKTATAEAERRLIEANGLKAAANATQGMTPSELQSICIQVWQQVISKGIDRGVPVYTSPCGSSGNSIIVDTK